MSWFPALPGWEGIHPAMIHFPVALLLVAPLLLLVSLFAGTSWRAWAGAALVVMALGALAAWLAVASGHAAGQLADKTAALQQAIERHEGLGLLTRNLFTLLTVVLAALLAVPAMMKKPMPAVARIVTFAAFIVVYAACAGVLANTANAGGRLVHEFGVRAMLDRELLPNPAAEATETPATATARR